MADKKKKGVQYQRGLGPALAALKDHMGSKALFMPPTHRSIPMRHRELGRLLAGDVNPGLPTGKFIEVLGQAGEGKTTFGLACADAVINQPPDTVHRIATDDGIEEIAAPRRVLINDFEHVLDYGYLKSAVRNAEVAAVTDKGRIVNAKTANVYVHQPDTIEEGGDVMLHMIASGEFGLVILDSVAAMLGDEEKHKSMGESTMGLQARAIGKFLRKSAHMVRRYGVTVILVNQWREKIGMCFAYGSKVLLADGSKMPIGKIVNQRLPVKVMSYNAATGTIEPCRVTQWHQNGKAESFLRLYFDGCRTSGRRQMIVTPNHVIYTPTGVRAAGELKVGDRVMAMDEHVFSADQHELILGSVLGDGSLRFECESRGRIRFLHGPKQAEYCRWKASVMGIKRVSVRADGVVSADSATSPEFSQYRSLSKQKRSGGRATLPQWAIDRITPAVAAVWFMDDGTHSGCFQRWGEGRYEISATKLNLATLTMLSEHFDRIGLGKPLVKVGKGLAWSGGRESMLFCRGVSPYVHPSMRYKIKQAGAAQFSWKPKVGNRRKVLVEATLVSSRVVTRDTGARKIGGNNRYDIGVEGNHNYFVDGVLVSNSYGDPRVAPGGKALEYWDAIRLNVGGGHSKPLSMFANGKLCRIKTLKNKVTGVRGLECEYEIGHGVGLSAEAELTQRAVACGLIQWRGGVGRPLKILPMKGRVFPDVPTWLAALRGSDRLFAQLQALCDKKSASRPKRGNGGFGADDDE